LRITVNDDLTDLTEFWAMVQGILT